MVQHEVAHEGETGKSFRANFYDRFGRTVLISRPGMQVLHSKFLAKVQNQNLEPNLTRSLLSIFVL